MIAWGVQRRVLLRRNTIAAGSVPVGRGEHGYQGSLEGPGRYQALILGGQVGSPYLTGGPPIRPLRSACPEPAGRTYGALAAAPLPATDRDRRRRGSFLACRAVRPENRGHVCRCRHSRGRLPHLSPSLA